MLNLMFNYNIEPKVNISDFPVQRAYLLHIIGTRLDLDLPLTIFGFIRQAFEEGKVSDGLHFGSLIPWIYKFNGVVVFPKDRKEKHP